MAKIDWTKPVRTVSGEKAVALCTNAPGAYPVVGYRMSDGDPQVRSCTWTLDGKFLEQGLSIDGLDLVQAEEAPIEVVERALKAFGLDRTDYSVREWATNVEEMRSVITDVIVPYVQSIHKVKG